MYTHIDGRPTGPTAEDIEVRKKQMQAYSTRQRRHRANRLDAKQEKELQERYRRAHMSQDERDIEDAIESMPWGQQRQGRCEAPDCSRDIHARRLCMMHYQRATREAQRQRTSRLNSQVKAADSLDRPES